MQNGFLCSLCLNTMILSAFQAVAAESTSEFRVSTEIHLGGKNEPVSSNLTLFSDDRVYDFMGTGMAAATVFHMPSGRFTIVAPSVRMVSRIERKKLVELNRARNAAVRIKGSPVDRFSAEPKFSVTFDDRVDSIWLSSSQLTYSVIGFRPADNSLVDRFRNFADWYAKLNAVAGRSPSGARVRLNSELAKHGLLPKRIKRIDHHSKRTAESIHHFQWRLSAADRQLISKTEANIGQFRVVTLLELLSAGTAVALENGRR